MRRVFKLAGLLGSGDNGAYLSNYPTLFDLVGRGRTTGVSFRECLGGYAACGLLRKNLPQSFGRSLSADATVFFDTSDRVLA